MKIPLACISVLALGLAACGSSPDDERKLPHEQSFNPPPAKAGYTRIVAPVMANLAPGSDVMYCQYIQAPLDRDMDILDVTGYQSTAGHHAVAYATTANIPVGTSGPCTEESSLAGAFVGGIGGEGGGGVTLPEGVAFRLPKGSAIMINTHFLNATNDVIDGQTVLDIKYAEVDPSRKIASFFVNINFGFNIPARGTGLAVAECPVARDLEFILFTNHMHDYGVRAHTDLVRAGSGALELVHADEQWEYEMQFKAVYSQWGVDQPLRIAKGDVLRTHCEWGNTSDAALAFPREMCVGVGFFLSDGSSTPMCANGNWYE